MFGKISFMKLSECSARSPELVSGEAKHQHYKTKHRPPGGGPGSKCQEADNPSTPRRQFQEEPTLLLALSTGHQEEVQS